MTKPGICRECGSDFQARRDSRAFCSTGCRQRYNNRRRARGSDLFDIFMAMRFERAVARTAGAWSLACRMASAFRIEDERERNGRKSWDAIGEVKRRHPHLQAVVINTNAAGMCRVARAKRVR